MAPGGLGGSPCTSGKRVASEDACSQVFCCGEGGGGWVKSRFHVSNPEGKSKYTTCIRRGFGSIRPLPLPALNPRVLYGLSGIHCKLYTHHACFSATPTLSSSPTHSKVAALRCSLHVEVAEQAKVVNEYEQQAIQVDRLSPGLPAVGLVGNGRMRHPM